MVTKHVRWSPNCIHAQNVCLRIALVFAITCFGTTFPITNVVAVETFWTSPNSGDWFDAQNWGGLIPNAPGDIAIFQSSAFVDISIELSSPVTLGELHFLGRHGFTPTGAGPLVFNNPGDDPALLSMLALHEMNIAAPIAIAEDEQLAVDIFPFYTLSLDGGIVSPKGDMTKIGGGLLELSADSPNWNGVLNVERGEVAIKSPQALGGTTGRTIIKGGSVQVTVAVAEPFTLEAGILETEVQFLDLDGHLTVPMGSTAVVHGPFNIRGGTSGDGDLHLVATGFAPINISNMPLNHNGGLTISSGESSQRIAGIGVDNTYQGPTIITDVQLNVIAANGLGTTDAGTTVINGSLIIVPTSREDVRLENSTLSLQLGDSDVSLNRFQGNITLSNSTLNTVAAFDGPSQYTIAQAITLDGGTNAIEPAKGALRIEGGIIGIGDLLLNPDDDDPIEVASRIKHQGTLEIRGGPVRFLVPDAYSKTVVVRNGGRLIIESPQAFDRITTIADDTPCCSTFGNIEVLPGSSLSANSVELFQGFIQGNVQTNGPIRFHGFAANRTISNLESGVNVEINGGELTIDDSDASRPATNGIVSILRNSEASILLARDSVTDAHINLNNGSGFNFGGALRTENDGNGDPRIIARGDIDLGNQGAHIGGTDGIIVEGQIRGGDLHLGRLRGAPALILGNETMEYIGETHIYSGSIRLKDMGRLQNTTGIKVYSEGNLISASSLADGPVVDRIVDDIPISLHGGSVSARISETGVHTVERVGEVNALRGISSLGGTVVSGGGGALGTASLSVSELNRSEGAVIAITSEATLLLENPPAVTNGILPAWIVRSVNFTTLDNGGSAISYQGPFVSFDTADETSIVRPPSNPSTVTADKTVHAIYAFGNVGPVDLGGHTVTVGSGGVSGATISNGTLKAGAHANGELFFFGGVTIDADIVDNGSPTSVTFVGDAELGGTNSYTGTTYIVGLPGDDVRVNSAATLPSGGDIEISGYTDLVLRDLGGSTAYQFGQVAIRDGGTLIAQCCGNGDTVTADEILLEVGTLAVPLVGNTRVIKNTDGLARMLFSSPDFSGRVDINNGILQAGEDGGLRDGYLPFGEAEVVVHSGASLVLTPVSKSKAQAAPLPNIMLKGGSLFGARIPQDSQVSLRGILEVVEPSRIYLLDGLEADPRGADIKIDGKIHISTGQSLSVIGRRSSSLTVTEGFQLDPGSILGGTGSIRAQVDISDGAILSPGLISEGSTLGTLHMSVPIFVADLAESQLTWGENGRYRWEINSVDGLVGADFGEGWDLVNAGPELLIDATPENPFVIEIVSLDEDGNHGLVDDLVTNVSYRWKIAEVAQINSFGGKITGFNPNKFAIDVSQLQEFYPQAREEDFYLERVGPAIFLNGVIVPEPSTIMILLEVTVIALGSRRH